MMISRVTKRKHFMTWRDLISQKVSATREEGHVSFLPRAVALWGGMVLAAALTPAGAALEVDFVTTRGTITAVMEYELAPMAVANLVTLANGTRKWIDPDTGRVVGGAFYDGQTFFKVVNSGSVKTIEIGSPAGDGSDNPGYAFPDEFDPGLTHVPYVLSMSNDGPNTNGARLCFTGNVTISARDQRNTVLGAVPSSASRSVIDEILVNEANTTTLNSIHIRRTDAAAVAYDENAVLLPEVSTVAAPLNVLPGIAVHWLGTQPDASVLSVYQSTNLTEWTPHFRHMVGLDDALPGESQIIDSADKSARFFCFSLVTYPEIRGVSNFCNRKLTIESPGIGTIIYQFNAAGEGGTYENIVLPGEPPFFSGSFEVRGEIPVDFGPRSFRVLLYANGLGGSPFNLIRGGLDVVGSDAVSGRHVTEFLSPSLNLVFEDIGRLELSRP
jgi:peptidyl-prolyl cis-trans isomerase A (cyclophilin A)